MRDRKEISLEEIYEIYRNKRSKTRDNTVASKIRDIIKNIMTKEQTNKIKLADITRVIKEIYNIDLYQKARMKVVSSINADKTLKIVKEDKLTYIIKV